MKINTPFLIVGIVLALIAIAGIFLVGSLLNPEPVPVPVALTDIPRDCFATRPIPSGGVEWRAAPDLSRALHR